MVPEQKDNTASGRAGKKRAVVGLLAFGALVVLVVFLAANHNEPASASKSLASPKSIEGLWNYSGTVTTKPSLAGCKPSLRSTGAEVAKDSGSLKINVRSDGSVSLSVLETVLPLLLLGEEPVLKPTGDGVYTGDLVFAGGQSLTDIERAARDIQGCTHETRDDVNVHVVLTISGHAATYQVLRKVSRHDTKELAEETEQIYQAQQINNDPFYVAPPPPPLKR